MEAPTKANSTAGELGGYNEQYLHVASGREKTTSPLKAPMKVAAAVAEIGDHAEECLHNTFGRDHVLGLVVAGKHILLRAVTALTHYLV